MEAAGPHAFDDIWTPDQPLPHTGRLREVLVRLGELWEMPELPGKASVFYNPRLRTTLGRAFLREFRVELNPRLLLDHPAELIPTLVHELAHLVVHHRYGRVAPHGLEFRTLMARAGITAAATHKLPIDHLRQKRRRRHRVVRVVRRR